jgi:hypothetical protein
VRTRILYGRLDAQANAFFLVVFFVLFFSLACAHSNAATDNLMQKLIVGNQLSVVRVGRPGTVTPALRAHCLEALIGIRSAYLIGIRSA